MGKIAFVFPGQGAQVVGMGQNVYENSAVAKDVFEQASKAVDLDLKALCFEENNDINITEFTQVCLLTTSVAIMEELKTANSREVLSEIIRSAELPVLQAMQYGAVTVWAKLPARIISVGLPERAVISFTAMPIMIWSFPGKDREALREL